MSRFLSRSKYYRDRAEECRRFSELVPTLDVKAEYQRMARQYTSLARVEEHLDKAHHLAESA